MDYDNMTVDEYSSENGRKFEKEPEINVITKEDFETRISEVFHLLWKTLARSFGPYGAPTIIYNYPFSHITKDGYTIMKNLSLNAAYTKVDQAIANMASDICGRLNYAVGDGTTTAVIATNSIYQQYRKQKNLLDDQYILPRDIINLYNGIKEKIITELKKKIVPIQTSNLDELYDYIYNVVFISSNGDETISTYIAELYKEIGSPAVSCIISPDGVTRKKLIEGYKFNLMLNDRLYVNNDNNTCDIKNADVVIFGTKITEDTYKKILKPLSIECEQRDRRLIVCAPSYDEKALAQTIAIDLNREYSKKKTINMILTTYRNITSQAKKYANDFSILVNTTIIDREMEEEIINKVDSGVHIARIFNIDNRKIKGLREIAIKKGTNGEGIAYTYGYDELPADFVNLNDFDSLNLIENYINLGFIGKGSIGLKATDSNFSDFHYDEHKYKKALEDAEFNLNDVTNKYKKLGTFNTEVSDAQERYYALKMKLGIIEVGGESELSNALNKDAVDDAVRAASSAFKYGILKGCNVNLIQVINDLYEKETDPTQKLLLNILLKGFRSVYKTVLMNAFEDSVKDDDTLLFPDKRYISSIRPDYGNCKNKTYEERIDCIRKAIENFFNHMNHDGHTIFDKSISFDIFDDSIKKILSKEDYNYLVNDPSNPVPPKIEDESGKGISVHDFIIDYSIRTGLVFDVTKLKFTDKVINSFRTDEEVLTATIDLISLLIVGNQMVVTGKHNF